MREPDYFDVFAARLAACVVRGRGRGGDALELTRRLERVRRGLGATFVLLRGGDVEGRLAAVLAEHLRGEVARLLGVMDVACDELGLGETPPMVSAQTEKDDVVQHNIRPVLRSHKDPKRYAKLVEAHKKQVEELEARHYRGLWWPAYNTPIVDLTQDDIALASAYLAGKLTTKGCARSDAAEAEYRRKNRGRYIFDRIQAIAEAVASAVMGAMFGPLGAQIVKLAHRGKMALIHKVWKLKAADDPQFKADLAKLQPSEQMSYRGFRFWLRPIGNMLAQELGCKADLETRLLIHGRLYRTLDVLAASLPSARSGPGLYDYPSAFGMLRGSIFPPRGAQLDGAPPSAAEEQQVEAIVSDPSVQAALRAPPASGEAMSAALMRSAHSVRGEVARQRAAQVAAAGGERSAQIWPVLVVGGVALGAALLAAR